MVLVLFLDFLEIDAHLGHGVRNVVSPNFQFLEVLSEKKVGGTDFLSDLLAVHVSITKQWDHVDALRRGQMDPLKRSIQYRWAVGVLDGVPFHSPLLERLNPVVVVSGMFLNVNDGHVCIKQRHNGKKPVERNPLGVETTTYNLPKIWL